MPSNSKLNQSFKLTIAKDRKRKFEIKKNLLGLLREAPARARRRRATAHFRNPLRPLIILFMFNLSIFRLQHFCMYISVKCIILKKIDIIGSWGGNTYCFSNLKLAETSATKLDREIEKLDS